MKLKAQTRLGWVVRGCVGVVGIGTIGSCMLFSIAVVFAMAVPSTGAPSSSPTQAAEADRGDTVAQVAVVASRVPVRAVTTAPVATEAATPTLEPTPTTPPTPTNEPTATIIPTPAPPQAQALQSNANFRSAAGADQAVAGQLCEGDRLAVTSQQQVDDVVWYKIEVVERQAGCESNKLGQGWVRGDLITTPSLPVVSYAASIGQTLPKPRYLPTATPQPTTPPRPAVAPKQDAACDPNYSGACIPNVSYDLDCGDVAARRFRVVGYDVHRFDRDHDGIACES